MATIEQLRKTAIWTPMIQRVCHENTGARLLAQLCGCETFSVNGRLYIEASDGIAETFWMNRKHSMLGVREAACPSA